jgi:hypothetical protein
MKLNILAEIIEFFCDYVTLSNINYPKIAIKKIVGATCRVIPTQLV